MDLFPLLEGVLEGMEMVTLCVAVSSTELTEDASENLSLSSIGGDEETVA